MWCWLHLRSTCSHVSASWKLHIGHVFYGNLWISKNSCFLALPMYWHVRNFSMVIFCGSVIEGLVQNLLDSSLSISGLLVHLFMFGNICAMIFKFFSLSCFWIYVSRHLTGPLSGLAICPYGSNMVWCVQIHMVLPQIYIVFWCHSLRVCLLVHFLGC